MFHTRWSAMSSPRLEDPARAHPLFVVVAVWLVVVLIGIEIPSAFSGVFSIAGMCVVGWLITHDLAKRYGWSSKFPGPGFKTMLSLLALSWVFVGAYVLLVR